MNKIVAIILFFNMFSVSLFAKNYKEENSPNALGVQGSPRAGSLRTRITEPFLARSLRTRLAQEPQSRNRPSSSSNALFGQVPDARQRQDFNSVVENLVAQARLNPSEMPLPRPRRRLFSPEPVALQEEDQLVPQEENQLIVQEDDQLSR